MISKNTIKRVFVSSLLFSALVPLLADEVSTSPGELLASISDFFRTMPGIETFTMINEKKFVTAIGIGAALTLALVNLMVCLASREFRVFFAKRVSHYRRVEK